MVGCISLKPLNSWETCVNWRTFLGQIIPEFYWISAACVEGRQCANSLAVYDS